MRRFATAGSAVQRACICAPCLRQLIQAELPLPSRLPVSASHRYRSHSAKTLSKESDASSRGSPPVLALGGSDNAEVKSNQAQDDPHKSSPPREQGPSATTKKSAKKSMKRGIAMIHEITEASATPEPQKEPDEKSIRGKLQKREKSKAAKRRLAIAKLQKGALKTPREGTEELRVGDTGSKTPARHTAKGEKAAGAPRTDAETDDGRLRELYRILARKYKVLFRTHKAWSADLLRRKDHIMTWGRFNKATAKRRWIISEICRADNLSLKLIQHYQRSGVGKYVDFLDRYLLSTQRVMEGLIESKHLYGTKSSKQKDSLNEQSFGDGHQPEAVIGPALYELRRYQAFRTLLTQIENVLLDSAKAPAGKPITWPDGRISQVAKLVGFLKDMKAAEDVSEKPDDVSEAGKVAEFLSKGSGDATRVLLCDLMPMVSIADQHELLAQLLVHLETVTAEILAKQNEVEEGRTGKSQKKASSKTTSERKASQKNAGQSQGVAITDLPGNQTIDQAVKAKTPAADSQTQPAAKRNADRLLANQRESLAPISTGTIDSAELSLQPIHVEQPPVRGLAYGLDRVLFNPGVYMLQEPRSKVYNFDPYLEKIMPVEDFNFDLIPGFITSSKDKTLQRIAQESAKKYTGSSSSMTGILSHFHFLLSRFRLINNSMLSRTFNLLEHHSEFSNITKGPSAICLRWKEEYGLYAIDSDKSFDEMNGLSLMGNSLEKLLTLPTDKYERYRRGSLDKISQEEMDVPETYHYTGIGDILMRSQLDAHDPRLPGTGMFDLKTRAVLPIRMDVSEYRENSGYEIRLPQGNFESFEREYIDMLRATMIKYMLQVRIGRMDGIFVAYHNTRRIFGFQYIPLEEIDLALHGQSDRSIGDREFKLSVKLMNEVFNKATERFPKTTLRMHFATGGGSFNTKMWVCVEPISEEEADKLQSKNEERNKMIVKEILSGASPSYDEANKRIFPGQESAAEASAEDTGAENVGEDGSKSAADIDAGRLEETTSEKADASGGQARPLLVMELRVKNIVNGSTVVRPGFPSESDKSKRCQEVSETFSEANGDQWTIKYTLSEYTDADRARFVYEQLLKKREKLFNPEREKSDLVFIRQTLQPYVENGRKYRELKDEEERANPTKVVLRDT